MFNLLLFLKCVILVKANILPGTQIYPFTAFEQNSRPETPVLPLIYTNNYQQALIQDQQLSTFSDYLKEHLKRVLLEKVLTSSLIHSLADDEHTDTNVAQYIPNSDNELKVINNYFILPPEYIDLSLNENQCQCCAETGKYNEYLGKSVDKLNKKVTNPKKSSSLSHRNKEKNIKSNNKVCEKEKKKIHKENTIRSSKKSTISDNNIVQSNNFGKSSKSKVSDSNSKRSNKKSEMIVSNNRSQKPTGITESDKKACDDSDDLNPKKKLNQHMTANVDVCFDINEDCSDLACRRTRNNNNDRNKIPQQQLPKEFSDNIVAYMNNILSNQQFNPNYFTQNGNLPYNFDYMFQLPQQTNLKSTGSANRKRNRKKKSKSNDNTKHIQNNKHDEKTDNSEKCQKEVELTPELFDIEEASEQKKPENPSKLINMIRDLIGNSPSKSTTEDTSSSQSTSGDVITPLTDSKNGLKEKIKDKAIPNKMSSIVNADPIKFLDDNELLYDYYPDFTSDNFYYSKEDYEFNKNHDRYYYSSDNRAEMSTDKHTYERANKINEHNNKGKAKHHNKSKNTDISEIHDKFRAPPALEFPDFRTVKINKDKYVPTTEIYYQPCVESESYKNINFPEGRNSYFEVNEDFDTGVETVYAQSKVVSYSPPIVEVKPPLFDSRELSRRDDKNLISKHGDTTLVLAKSLGYLEDF